jgi:hypothetical protein
MRLADARELGLPVPLILAPGRDGRVRHAIYERRVKAGRTLSAQADSSLRGAKWGSSPGCSYRAASAALCTQDVP